MIIKRSTVAAGLLGGLLLMSPPALAEGPAGPVSPAELKTALLLPEDLGAEFVHNKIRNREFLDAETAHTKACAKAIKGLAPFSRSKAATWLMRDGVPEGVREFIVSGTRAQLSTLERAAKVMVRDCGQVRAGTKNMKKTITKLPVGRLGDSAYGIRYWAENPATDQGPVMAVDIVIIKVGDAMIALEHSGFYGRFDPDLTRPAAEKAATRLREALESSSRG
ncbi:hypothetical protein ACWDLG_43345 [Nonomuraea sp. NPDC003727]